VFHNLFEVAMFRDGHFVGSMRNMVSRMDAQMFGVQALEEGFPVTPIGLPIDHIAVKDLTLGRVVFVSERKIDGHIESQKLV
jgi:hypothetical protein